MHTSLRNLIAITTLTFPFVSSASGAQDEFSPREIYFGSNMSSLYLGYCPPKPNALKEKLSSIGNGLKQIDSNIKDATNQGLGTAFETSSSNLTFWHCEIIAGPSFADQFAMQAKYKDMPGKRLKQIGVLSKGAVDFTLTWGKNVLKGPLELGLGAAYLAHWQLGLAFQQFEHEFVTGNFGRATTIASHLDIGSLAWLGVVSGMMVASKVIGTAYLHEAFDKVGVARNHVAYLGQFSILFGKAFELSLEEMQHKSFSKAEIEGIASKLGATADVISAALSKLESEFASMEELVRLAGFSLEEELLLENQEREMWIGVVHAVSGPVFAKSLNTVYDKSGLNPKAVKRSWEYMVHASNQKMKECEKKAKEDSEVQCENQVQAMIAIAQ